MKLGEKLQELRKEKDLSQEKIAELIGVSRQAVSKWENDLSYPDSKNLIKLSEVFNVSMDEKEFYELAKIVNMFLKLSYWN